MTGGRLLALIVAGGLLWLGAACFLAGVLATPVDAGYLVFAVVFFVLAAVIFHHHDS